MKKVIFFTDSLVSGGAQRQLSILAANINRQKFEPIVVIYHNLRNFQPTLNRTAVRIEYIPKYSKLDLSFLWRLSRFLRSEKAEILLSYLNTPNIWARLAGRLAGVEYIITSERNTDINHSKVRVIIERLLHRWSTLIVVNAIAIRDMLVNELGIPDRKVQVIYNGVEVDRFSHPDPSTIARLRKDFGLTCNDQVILLPGRMTKQKNHICLVRAFCRIAQLRPRIKLLFVGNEIDKAIKAKIIFDLKSRGLDTRVVFAGYQSEMSEVYALSSIVVLPSLWEGFPNVILEAMAASCPVLASDVADNKRLVADGETGYLFAPDRDEQLASKLVAMLDCGEDYLSSMGKAGYQKIKKSYSMQMMVKNYEKLFSKLKVGSTDYQ